MIREVRAALQIKKLNLIRVRYKRRLEELEAKKPCPHCGKVHPRDPLAALAAMMSENHDTDTPPLKPPVDRGTCH